MCQYNSVTTIYKCGAVEHLETKGQDCERTECVNSKKHPRRCFPQLTDQWPMSQNNDHGPLCRDYHETTFVFANKPSEQCPDKNCRFVQNQDDPGFIAAVDAIRAEVQEKILEQERAEQDAASTMQLRDEPM